MCRNILLVFLLVNLSACIHDTTAVQLVVSGLNSPWGMTFIDDKQLLVTEKSGTTKLVNVDTGEFKEIHGLPDIEIIGQGGLLDIALSPNFARDSSVYFTYAKPIIDDGSQSSVNAYATSLAVARLDDFKLLDWQDLFISNVQTKNRQHFGSRIAFDDDGHVFFSHGDRGERENSQDLSNHGGTILRLNLDGSVPQDNPFVGDANVQPEIWSYGHRNPQGLFFDSKTQQLWSNEHGPKGGDEINLISRGGNYGWPVLSYGREYFSGAPVGEATEREGFVSPVKYWDPSIAPSSLIVYRGDKYSQLEGTLISSALVLKHLNIISLNDQGQEESEVRMLKTLSERIRNVVQSPDGDIYIATDAGDIYRLLTLQSD